MERRFNSAPWDARTPQEESLEPHLRRPLIDPGRVAFLRCHSGVIVGPQSLRRSAQFLTALNVDKNALWLLRTQVGKVVGRSRDIHKFSQIHTFCAGATLNGANLYSRQTLLRSRKGSLNDHSYPACHWPNGRKGVGKMDYNCLETTIQSLPSIRDLIDSAAKAKALIESS